MVVGLVILAYAVKVYSKYKIAHSLRVHKEIKRLLMESVDNSRDVNPKLLLKLKRYIETIIAIINELDASIDQKKWPGIRKSIIEHIILPQALIWAKKRAWHKRYIACKAFGLSLNDLDEPTLKSLINDPVPLVAINAATLAIHCRSQPLIDAVIDSFQKSRRIRQSLYAQVISTADKTIIPLIKHRLLRETNPYIKAFCYRTLTELPSISETIKTTSKDLESENLDLKLSVMAYLRHTEPKSSKALFASLLKDNHWEVRAKSAKLLGDIGDKASACSLEDCLKDKEWWVRINAAQSLAKLGPTGILILKRQNPSVDQFAYEVSMQVLSIHDSQNMYPN